MDLPWFAPGPRTPARRTSLPDLRPTTRALLNAVWHADLNLTRRLLAAHPLDVNAAVDRQNTLLFFAARVPGYNGHGDAPTTDAANELVRVEIIDLLVSLGADVNARNQRKVTPLHMAARYGLPLVAAALLRHGADVDARDVNHETPLYRAANLGYPPSPGSSFTTARTLISPTAAGRPHSTALR